MYKGDVSHGWVLALAREILSLSVTLSFTGTMSKLKDHV